MLTIVRMNTPRENSDHGVRLNVEDGVTEFGPVEYATAGDGQPVLMSHGVMGGHPAGLEMIATYYGSAFAISPSRFGYFGSSLPVHATPASTTLMPRSANRSVTADLPLPIPPVTPTTNIAPPLHCLDDDAGLYPQARGNYMQALGEPWISESERAERDGDDLLVPDEADPTGECEERPEWNRPAVAADEL
jgi:hypothetical protein